MEEVNIKLEKLGISDNDSEGNKQYTFPIQNQKYESEFTELKYISSGGFGIVFEVSDNLNPGQTFAMKKIPLSEDNVEKFCEECKFLKKINNENVVKCVKYWIENNYYLDSNSNLGAASNSTSSNLCPNIHEPNKPLLLHIQMELCYKTMREIIIIVNKELNREKLKENSILFYYVSSEIFKELVGALNYLHKRNPPIIHRDLKPINILIAKGVEGCFVKLADFGLAVFHKFEDQSHTKEAGTDKYMAPEVRKTRKYGPKADIYSLGVTMKELFKDIIFVGIENLLSRMKEINELIRIMTAAVASSRPTCQQILDKREYWEIDIKQLIDDKKLKLKRIVNSIEESFHLFFIQTKLRDYENIFNDENGDKSSNFDEKEVTSGYYGIVCKAYEKSSMKPFAIKKIPMNETVKEKALIEIKIWSELETELIVKLESFWIENNYYHKNHELIKKHKLMDHKILETNNTLLLYIQMELCYKTLREIIEIVNIELNQRPSEVMSPLSYYISSELFIEILECVSYLHQKKIIHRDLKPSNILITYGTKNRFVKVTDLCSATKHGQDDESHSQILMNEIYAAPEVQNSRTYDTKADIYSLGWICQHLYEFKNNKTIRENKYFKTKLSNLYEMSDKMISYTSEKRPNCGQILKDKDSWALSLIQLMELTDLKTSSKVNSIEECFHMFFIQKKIELNIHSLQN